MPALYANSTPGSRLPSDRRRSCASAAGSAATATATRTSPPTRCARRSRRTRRQSSTSSAAAGARARCRAVDVAVADAASAQLPALAHASPDPSPQRADEPYRRALTGVYARLLATAGVSGWTLHAQARASASANAVRVGERASPHDLQTGASTRCGATAANASRGCASIPLLRAVYVFGFHGATLDLRQSSDVLEAVVARTARRGRGLPGLSAPGRERTRTAAVARTRPRAAAGVAAPATTAPARSPSSQCSTPRANCAQRSARVRSNATSCRTRRRSPTCSKWRCCRRKAGCSAASSSATAG